MSRAGEGRRAGSVMATASILLGILWITLGYLVSRVGSVITPAAGGPHLDDTSGISGIYMMLTPVVLTCGIALAGLSYALIRRIRWPMVVGAFINVTLIIWAEILFRVAVGSRVR